MPARSPTPGRVGRDARRAGVQPLRARQALLAGPLADLGKKQRDFAVLITPLKSYCGVEAHAKTIFALPVCTALADSSLAASYFGNSFFGGARFDSLR